jgi:hypothetical protein
MFYTFNSQIKELGNFSNNFSQDQIKNETMFFNCDLNFAYENGREITRNFIDNLPQSWKNCKVRLDSRVHMLMVDWWPCIPGYHHDDIPRSTKSGQPNYDNPEYLSQHLMGLVNGDICPTYFAIGNHHLPKIENDLIYKRWNKIVEEQIENKELEIYKAKSGTYIEFDWQSMHTGSKAIKSGWRWFCRLSRNTDRVNNIKNEIRRQVQVYMEDPMQGW